MKLMQLIGLVMAICSMMSQAAYAEEPHWGNFTRYGCYDGAAGYAKYAAVLWGISGDWETACAKQGANIKNAQGTSYEFFSPTACRNHNFNMWGEFAVPEQGC